MALGRQRGSGGGVRDIRGNRFAWPVLDCWSALLHPHLLLLLHRSAAEQLLLDDHCEWYKSSALARPIVPTHSHFAAWSSALLLPTRTCWAAAAAAAHLCFACAACAELSVAAAAVAVAVCPAAAMPVAMRLMRMGTTHNPVYRISIGDSRKVPTAKFIEHIGTYNPKPDKMVCAHTHEDASG
jgi:hypothetical protein